ncbi:MAG: hypothetical protein IT161_08545 [Bryobacterales bacterium]|nr:hypothetical protein [Bryobacterales bacterium]
MRLTYLLGFCAAVLIAGPPSDTLVEGKAQDAQVTIEVKLDLDRASATKAVGLDPGESIVVLEVRVTPAPGKKVNIAWDDFLIRSDRDGQRSTAMHPAQVAGDTVLVVKDRGGSQGQAMSEQRRIPYGIPGIPGTGGRPTTLPGSGAPAGGSATADTSHADASIEGGDSRKANPLLAALTAKVLPEGETDKPVNGLLYFVMDGKHRPKDIEFLYRRTPPRLSIRFGGKKS